MDLHETTDTDKTEFRPAKAARDGEDFDPDEEIPDGFYLVGDSECPQSEWHAAIINAVREVTHIAPGDTICGEKSTQEGTIAVPTRSLFLCSSATNASFATTTEVYPDSPRTDGEQCNLAQVAAVTAGLDFLVAAAAAQ